MRAQIEEFYRKLHADNYDDPNDERLAAMWLLSGSLLFRGNVCKKAYVFLGSEGDNGKSTFTELIQLTLGDYAVTGTFRRARPGDARPRPRRELQVARVHVPRGTVRRERRRGRVQV